MGERAHVQHRLESELRIQYINWGESRGVGTALTYQSIRLFELFISFPIKKWILRFVTFNRWGDNSVQR
jgi:hypothetical protein